MKAFSSLISWLFLPLFTPIYGLLVVLYLPVNSISFISNESLYLIDPIAKMLLLLLFFVFIVLAPGLSFLVMKKNKTISSLQMEKREERAAPIILVTFYCTALFFFLNIQDEGAFIPSIIKAMVLGGCISSLLAYFFTKKMKISLHSIGMGALFGFIYMFVLPLQQIPLELLVLVLLISGIVMSARLILKAHTMKEISWGYLLGFFSQVICIYFYV